MPDAVELEPRLDELFAAPPDAFVKTREALVRDLKRAGRAAQAAEIHALRRPTIAVWSINQTARSHADRLRAFVDAGADVQRLQAGGAVASDDLRAASRSRRALLNELTDAASALTDRPDAYRGTIAATLDAASLDEELECELLGGRLTEELAPAVRFPGEVDDAAAPVGRAPVRRARPTKVSAPAPARARTRDDLALRRATTALADARARVAALDEELHEAEAESRDAHQMLEAAHQRVGELEAALVEARAGVAAARRRTAESQRTEAKARTAQRRAEAALQVAERQARDAGA